MLLCTVAVDKECYCSMAAILDMVPDINKFELAKLVNDGNKIQAIKKLREIVPLGLKESKWYVELIYFRHMVDTYLNGGDSNTAFPTEEEK